MSANKKPKKKQPVKRKKPMPGPVTAEIKSEVITSTNSTLDELEVPGEKKLKVAGEGPNTPKPKEVAPTASGATPIYSVIQTANPISALYEYCKKVKYPDPAFECVSENILETWQKNNHTFKRSEEHTSELSHITISYAVFCLKKKKPPPPPPPLPTPTFESHTTSSTY